MPKPNFLQKKNLIIPQLVLALIFVYVLLFEFILPVNKILPKPTVLIDSLIPLFTEYNFISEYLFTFASIYIIIFLSFLLISLFKNIMIRMFSQFPGGIKLFQIGKYFIPLFLILLFDQWFGNSTIGEYFFIIILVMGFLKISFFESLQLIKEEYLISGRSLGLNEKEISDKIIWKTIQPKIFTTIQDNHIVIWSYAILYEFICKSAGIGTLLNTAIKFNDLSVIVLLILFIILTFFVMELVLQSLKQKFFFWN